MIWKKELNMPDASNNNVKSGLQFRILLLHTPPSRRKSQQVSQPWSEMRVNWADFPCFFGPQSQILPNSQWKAAKRRKEKNAWLLEPSCCGQRFCTRQISMLLFLHSCFSCFCLLLVHPSFIHFKHSSPYQATLLRQIFYTKNKTSRLDTKEAQANQSTMGIKGLISYLKDRTVSAEDVTLDPNTTTLLIDGSGVCLSGQIYLTLIK